MSQNIFDSSKVNPYKLDDQNPYPGPYPFREKDKNFFFGRETETNDLFDQIQKTIPTVLFGKSGIGKTSLLQAGLIPKLRENYFLPIYTETRFGENNEKDLLEQLKSFIEEKVKELDKETVSIEDLSLWEYFHKVKIFDGLIKPLLIFDQFEEILKIGKDSPERINPMIIEIGDLVQDWVPLVVQEKYRDVCIPYGDKDPDYRVIFSLREDYLAQLMNLRKYMPSIVNGRNHYRVLQVKGENAVDAILKPGKEIIKDKKVAIEIIKKFSESKDFEYIPYEKQDCSWENRKIAPFLLSLFCYKVNEKRQKIKAGEISPKLLKGVSLEDVVKEYYEDVINQFDPVVKLAIETELLTPTGERKLQEINSLKEKYHIPEDDFERLVDNRIIREERRNDVIYIELIHDAFAPIIKEKRDKRLKEIERQNLREQLRKSYSRIFVIVSLVLAMIFFVIAAIALFEKNRANEQFRNAQLNRLTTEAQLEFPRDSTKAIRIAEAAYEMGLPTPPARTYQVLSDIGYSSYERPFYIRDLHHNGVIYTAVFSPFGSCILTASADNTARLWDIDGTQLQEFKHKARVSSAVFSPGLRHSFWKILDSEFFHVVPPCFSMTAIILRMLQRMILYPDSGDIRILTASWDKTAKIWDLGGKISVNFPHNAVVTSAVYSHDGSHIITTSRDGRARVWDIKGNEQFSIEHDGVFSAVFSPDNDNRILTASWDKTVKVWDREGTFLFSLEHKGAVNSAVFSPDGQKVLSASVDGTVTLWTLEDKSFVELKLNGKPASAMFLHDGSKILTASRDGTVNVWNLDGSRMADFKYNGKLYSAMPSPDGRNILVAAEDGTAKVWKLKNNILADFIKLPADVKKTVFSPNDDKSLILTASTDGFARLWDREGKKCLQEFPHKDKDMVSSAVFSPDAKQILTASGQSAILWDLKANRLGTFPHLEGAVTSASFAPDGKRILTTSVDGTAKVWTQEQDQQEPLLTLRHEAPVISGVFSHDNRWILTASSDGNARVWNLQGNAVLKLKHKGRVSSCEFSPDDKLILTASADSTVKIFNRKGEELLELKHNGPVASAVFSHSGQRILGASYDGTVKLWDIKGNLLADMDKHTGAVNSAVFSKDDRWILSASRDKTVKLWKSPEAIFESLKEAKFHPSLMRTKENWESKMMNDKRIQINERRRE